MRKSETLPIPLVILSDERQQALDVCCRPLLDERANKNREYAGPATELDDGCLRERFGAQ